MLEILAITSFIANFFTLLLLLATTYDSIAKVTYDSILTSPAVPSMSYLDGL